jgi:hypothetical protein
MLLISGNYNLRSNSFVFPHGLKIFSTNALRNWGCCICSTAEREFVVSGQQLNGFSKDFFAKRCGLWCNRHNFPKGGWPGSLAEPLKLMLDVAPVPEPYV